MRRLGRPIVLAIVLAAAAGRAAEAQGRGGPNWTTTGSDAQRTAWVKTDPRISRESLQKPGFQLLWKTKLENQARHLESLTQPILLSNIISYKGFKALAFVGGSADNVYSIDYDLNKIFWKRHLNTLPAAAGTITCPGAMTTMTRATPLGATAPASPAPPGPRGANTNVYAVSSGGQLHTLNPQTGDDFTPPLKFLPPNTKAVGSILIEPILYVATRDGCGSAANGVYAIDLASEAKTVTHWDAKGVNVAGTAGPTFGTDGNMFVATDGGSSSGSNDANAVVALDRETLAAKDWFSPGKSAFTASPVAFTYKGKHLIVAANADGRLYVLDAASLGGPDHRTPLSKSPPSSTATADVPSGALATAEQADGTRWVFATTGGPLPAGAAFGTTNGAVTNGAIVAYKIVEENGTPALQPAWASRDMVSPAPPTIVNGIVFAISSGEYRSGDAQMTAAQRVQRSKPAVLYALDAATGKELWSSGTAIASFVRGVGPSAGDGQVYVVTYDGTIYAFGIPLEH